MKTQVCIYLWYRSEFFLEWENFQRKVVGKNHIFNRAFYEIKNIVQPGGGALMTIRRMCFACRITKVTNTHSEYAILVDFLWWQCLHERPSLLHLYIYFQSCYLHRPNNVKLYPGGATRQTFPHPSGLDVVPIHPPRQWTSGLFPGGKAVRTCRFKPTPL